MSNKKYIAIIAILIGFGIVARSEAKIDFEGFGPLNAPLNEGEIVAVVRDQGVDVSFYTMSQTGEISAPFIAQIGAPRVGFQSTLSDDTPVNPDGSVFGAGGQYSLTDGLRQTHDYMLEFSRDVANLRLNVYDFRGDGTHSLGQPGADVLELKVFDRQGNLIAVDNHTIPTNRPIDGNVVELGVNVQGIASAMVDFNSIEGGTAIDNITFVVPEPNSLGLASLGLIGLLSTRRRRQPAT